MRRHSTRLMAYCGIHRILTLGIQPKGADSKGCGPCQGRLTGIISWFQLQKRQSGAQGGKSWVPGNEERSMSRYIYIYTWFILRYDDVLKGITFEPVKIMVHLFEQHHIHQTSISQRLLGSRVWVSLQGVHWYIIAVITIIFDNQRLYKSRCKVSDWTRDERWPDAYWYYDISRPGSLC